jgi:DNA-3-methyladenine glycosylase II
MNAMKPKYWQEGKSFLAKSDFILEQLIRNDDDKFILESKNDPIFTFCKIIIGQQISISAAEAIFQRFEKIINKNFTTNNILKTPEDKLKEAGFSKQKITYLKNICNLIDAGSLKFEHLAKLPDNIARKELCKIHGIGPWSADMFLIFNQLRPNILPLGDIGLIKMIEQFYNKGKKLNIAKIKEITKKWHPYTTIATWYLWRQCDAEPVYY